MHQIKVYIDYKNITHFSITENFNKRQLRYAEYFVKFDYMIIYRKGLENGRIDVMSKQPAMEKKQFPVSHTIFKQTKEGYFRQRNLASIII